MAWNPFRGRLFVMINEHERNERARRWLWLHHLRISQQTQAQNNSRVIEKSIAAFVLLGALLCGCCEPFRVWVLGILHMLAAH